MDGEKDPFPLLLVILMTVTKLSSTCFTTQYIMHLLSIQSQGQQGVIKKVVQPLVKVNIKMHFSL